MYTRHTLFLVHTECPVHYGGKQGSGLGRICRGLPAMEDGESNLREVGTQSTTGFSTNITGLQDAAPVLLAQFSTLDSSSHMWTKTKRETSNHMKLELPSSTTIQTLIDSNSLLSHW